MAAVTLFRQGALVVSRTHRGYRVVHGDVVADLDDAGDVVTTIVPDTADARQGFEAVVLVVADALRRRQQGWFHLHAGAVAIDEGIVLIAGDGGQGKTTTTLALEARGAIRCADDVVYVRRDGAAVVAKPWPRPLHVGKETRRMFPALECSVVGGRSLAGKAIVDVDGDDRERVVVALIMPRIDRAVESTTRASGMGVSDVMAHLLTASAMVSWQGLPHAQAHLDVLGALTSLPAVALTIGADALDDPACIADVIATAVPPLQWP